MRRPRAQENIVRRLRARVAVPPTPARAQHTNVITRLLTRAAVLDQRQLQLLGDPGAEQGADAVLESAECLHQFRETGAVTTAQHTHGDLSLGLVPDVRCVPRAWGRLWQYECYAWSSWWWPYGPPWVLNRAGCAVYDRKPGLLSRAEEGMPWGRRAYTWLRPAR